MLTIDRDGRSAEKNRHLTGPLAALLKSPNRAMQDNEVSDALGVDIAVAIDPLKSSLFLKLLDEIFVECGSELSG